MISKSISTSTKLTEVSLFAKLLFTWLIPHCDDAGHMDANPKIIKGIVVPLCDETWEDVDKALKELEKATLIEFYESDGRPYLEIIKWDEHQTFKNDRPLTLKFPARNRVDSKDFHMDSKRKPNPRHDVSLSSLPFSTFWDMYPRKVEKKKARDKWDRLDPKKQALAIADLPKRMKSDDQWLRGFIPHPTTYINGERWEDEIRTEGAKSKLPEVRKTLKV